jgi:hypothetical protein
MYTDPSGYDQQYVKRKSVLQEIKDRNNGHNGGLGWDSSWHGGGGLGSNGVVASKSSTSRNSRDGHWAEYNRLGDPNDEYEKGSVVCVRTWVPTWHGPDSSEDYAPVNPPSVKRGKSVGYYETPVSQVNTIIGSIAGMYSKINSVIAKELHPIISTHWAKGALPVLKYSKFVPYIGWPSDLLSFAGAVNNINGFGWTTEHVLDLSFAFIGFFPGYGDAASFLYMGSKEMYYVSEQVWEATKVGIYRFEHNLPTLPNWYGN